MCNSTLPNFVIPAGLLSNPDKDGKRFVSWRALSRINHKYLAIISKYQKASYDGYKEHAIDEYLSLMSGYIYEDVSEGESGVSIRCEHIGVLKHSLNTTLNKIRDSRVREEISNDIKQKQPESAVLAPA